VRVDAGIRSGTVVPVFYDSLLAKIIVAAEDRPAAVARLRATLAATTIAGIATNLTQLRAIAADDAFAHGETTTAFLTERAAALGAFAPPRVDDALRAAVVAVAEAGRGWRLGGIGVPVAFVDGTRVVRAIAMRTSTGWSLSGDVAGEPPTGARVHVDDAGVDVDLDGRIYRFAFAPPPQTGAAHTGHVAVAGAIVAPMPGKIVGVNTTAGATVTERELLVVLEAMKMEHRIEAPAAGTVASIHVATGDIVPAGALLVTLA
jgi:acetyl/propionyl-CoA carboxylase alpha subunit